MKAGRGGSRLKAEMAIIRMDEPAREVERLGAPVALTCPDCGGPILEVADGGIPRYLCQVGHGFAGPLMLTARLEFIERQLWHLVSSLEEAARVAESLARTSRARRHGSEAAAYEKQAERSRGQAEVILNIIRRSV